MEYIEEILSKNKSSDKADIVARLFVALFFFTVCWGLFYWIVATFKSGFLIAILSLVSCSAVTIFAYMLGTKIGKLIFQPKKLDFTKTKLCKRLREQHCLEQFMDQINKEINNESTIKYYSEICGYGLLVTETWFVYIESRQPRFVKTKDIVKISDERSEKSHFHMFVELKDGKCICMGSASIDDIEEEIKQKYPNIEIGTAIIEE